MFVCHWFMDKTNALAAATGNIGWSGPPPGQMMVQMAEVRQYF
jgi:hypothetical protein